MFYKLLATILALGLIAATLLVLRQKRIDHAHEMARAHQQLVEHETKLWQLRAQVISRCRPEDVREAVEQSGLSWNEILQRPVETPSDAAQLADGDDSTAHPTSQAGG